MPLDDIVNVTIEADTTSPSVPGFGTIALLVSKVPTLFPTNLPSVYRNLTEMVDDGFTSDDPAYKLASKIWQQKTRVKSLKVWKRSLPQTQALQLTCLSATEGDKYHVEINGTSIDYTVLSSETTTTVATAIELLIEAVTNVESSSSAAVISFAHTSAVAGQLLTVANWSKNFSFFDNTSDPGIATDLDALLAADKDFYGIALDSNSKAEVTAAAGWAETNKRLFGYTTSDSACAAGTSGNIFLTLQALGYIYTFGLYNGNNSLSYAASGWMGGRFPFKPGSYTWKFKSIAGVSPDVLTGTQITNIENANGNNYTTVAGVPITSQGVTAGGEFIDITQSIDWLRSDIQVRVFTLLANAPKVPFTNFGIDMVKNAVEGSLAAAVKAGILDPGGGKDANGDVIPGPFVTFPDVLDISVEDRGNRHLPDGQFGGRLQGAIHSLDLNGTLSV